MIPSGSLCKEGEDKAKERYQRKQVEKGGPGDNRQDLPKVDIEIADSLR